MLATASATAAYAALHPDLPGNFRLLDGLTTSSLGLGTYLGKENQTDDELYRDAAFLALQSGVNLLDTAINYRAQRSERALGETLLHLDRIGLSREQVVVCTKAGFLPFDGSVPRDGEAYLSRTYLDSGLVPRDRLAAGCHSLHPPYLQDQLGRSLHNLRLDGVDVFYLHNPEIQLEEVSREEFERRLRAAFVLCEDLCKRGRIGRYGCATWDGFRALPEDPGYLSLERTVALAREAGGEEHRFRVVQLPLNFAMTEALSRRNQVVGGEALTLLGAAQRLGVAVVCSGPLLQGRVLSRPLPPRLRAPMPELSRDSQRALQFVRSAPGVTAALCGMKTEKHVQDNLQVLHVPPMAPGVFAESFRE